MKNLLIYFLRIREINMQNLVFPNQFFYRKMGHYGVGGLLL